MVTTGRRARGRKSTTPLQIRKTLCVRHGGGGGGHPQAGGPPLFWWAGWAVQLGGRSTAINSRPLSPLSQPPHPLRRGMGTEDRGGGRGGGQGARAKADTGRVETPGEGQAAPKGEGLGTAEAVEGTRVGQRMENRGMGSAIKRILRYRTTCLDAVLTALHPVTRQLNIM